MKVVLILMIKNEEKILKRCLEAVEDIVDAFCIHDTGSTDRTKEIALEFLKTHDGCFTEEPFRNFGYSRSKSFEEAQKHVRDVLKWELTATYGLLLDADMVFVPGTLKKQNLTGIGYSLLQKNGSLEYYNARLVRMDFAWKCISVTHEYWDGPTERLGKDVCFIDDKNDGGCKHDKFERDKRLLEEGLLNEPANVRYMFYLGQTYKCLGQFKESIDMYQKRVDAGGWSEEVFYSMLMIGECYLAMKDAANFEKQMQMAYNFRPTRSEPLYKLAEFFRVKGDHYKAYHYIQLGRTIPFPKDDVLFIDSNVYTHLFDYEASIVEYYVHRDRGLASSMVTMMKTGNYQANIVANLKFYVSPLASKPTPLNIPSPFGEPFRPSAVSVCNYPFANVRFVNYTIKPDGSYDMPNGIVETKNAYFNLDTLECISTFEDPLPPLKSHIKGFEDLRLYSANEKLYFTATSAYEYIDRCISIVHGEYDHSSKSYKNYVAIRSPQNSECEKNWTHVAGTDDFIYGWNPLRIGKIQNDTFHITKTITTPEFFSLLRGSAPAIDIDGKWVVLTHFVEYCQPRNYYHCLVELEKETYVPTKVSFPFIFHKPGIEFCISGRHIGNNDLEFFVSGSDRDPFKIVCNYNKFNWISFKNKV